jgi:hypothetical protein
MNRSHNKRNTTLLAITIFLLFGFLLGITSNKSPESEPKRAFPTNPDKWKSTPVHSSIHPHLEKESLISNPVEKKRISQEQEEGGKGEAGKGEKREKNIPSIYLTQREKKIPALFN